MFAYHWPCDLFRLEHRKKYLCAWFVQVITRFRVQFGINKQEYIFQRLTKFGVRVGNLGSFKNLQALVYSKLHKKNHVINY